METAFHPAFGDQVRYRIERLSDNPEVQVRQTIKRIIEYIRKDARSPFIQEEARKMVELGDGNPNLGVWRLLKPQMQFTPDEEIAKGLGVKDQRAKDQLQDAIEVFIRPVDQWLLIKMRGLGIGDCDCFHMYAACLLTALDIPCALVTISAAEDRPEEFSHVYLASYWNGVRTPLDISHGDYPGQEHPNLGRLKEWPVHVTKREQLCDGLLIAGGFSLAYAGLKFLERRAA